MAAVLLSVDLFVKDRKPGECVLSTFLTLQVSLICIGCATFVSSALWSKFPGFRSDPFFTTPEVEEIPSLSAMFLYYIIGIMAGVMGITTTKVLYWLEDFWNFTRIPWVFWPGKGSPLDDCNTLQ